MKMTTLSFSSILFIVFLILKLCSVISWSWWWVTAPLWISAIIDIILVIVEVIINIRKK